MALTPLASTVALGSVLVVADAAVEAVAAVAPVPSADAAGVEAALRLCAMCWWWVWIVRVTDKGGAPPGARGEAGDGAPASGGLTATSARIGSPKPTRAVLAVGYVPT